MIKDKQDYEKIKLNERQKRDLVQRLKKPQSKRSIVPFVFVGFIALAMFSFFLLKQPSTPTTTTASQQLPETTHEAMFQQYFLELGILAVLIIFISLLAAKLLQQPGRFMRYQFFRKNRKAIKTRVAIVAIILYGAIVWISLIRPLEYLQWIFMLVILIASLIIQLYATRNNKRATCPNCGIELKNKEILLLQRCSACGEKKRKTTRKTAKQVYTYTHGFFIIPIFTMFQFPLLTVIIFAVIYTAFTFIATIPYIESYTKDDGTEPPLW